MKKITTLIIGCSLALVAGAFAQQDADPSTSPSPKKRGPEARQARQEARQEARQANQGAAAAEASGRSKAHAGMKARQEQNAPANPDANATTETKANAATSAAPNAQRRAERRAARNAAMDKPADTTTTTATAPAERAKGNRGAKANAGTKMQAETQPATTTAAANQGNARPNKGNKAKKPDTQVVQKIQAQHANFKAQARPQQIQSVTFNAGYTIPNSQNWQGEQYSVFRSYHPERHDRTWYHAHYPRIELIAGGYYYFNNGYWVPAFGYDTSAEYYAYEGPIYAGRAALPPDRVIANVQAALQELGYYKGEVDGLLGPLTRDALTGYQTDNGIYATATIDEPTLDSLGMGS